ncbi:MAG: hypothetical protein V3U25_00720 [Nitrososphaerales archaeon]|nr:hypothetical protein [Nitrososphaerota archaeon]
MTKIGKVEKKYVKAKCPECGEAVNQDADFEAISDESSFAGYKLKCEKCGEEFHYRLY